MSCQGLSSICGLPRTWYFLLGVLLIGLNGFSFMLGVLLADLVKSLRSRISLMLKADGELPKVISFVFSFFVIVCGIAYVWCFLLGVSLLGLHRVLFVLSVLPADLDV